MRTGLEMLHVDDEPKAKLAKLADIDSRTGEKSFGFAAGCGACASGRI